MDFPDIKAFQERLEKSDWENENSVLSGSDIYDVHLLIPGLRERSHDAIAAELVRVKDLPARVGGGPEEFTALADKSLQLAQAMMAPGCDSRAFWLSANVLREVLVFFDEFRPPPGRDSKKYTEYGDGERLYNLTRGVDLIQERVGTPRPAVFMAPAPSAASVCMRFRLRTSCQSMRL